MAANGPQALPADLLHLLSEQLAAKADYATLFSLVVSCKTLATAGAISALYRISHESPIKGGGSEGLSMAEQGLIVQKWAILWRTVICSAIGTTMYPYCRHLRMLDLRDLSYLLEDDRFRDRISKHFFAGELARFRITESKKYRSRSVVRLDSKKIVQLIGDEIVPHAPLLEALSEPVPADLLSASLLSASLPEWVPRLRNLRYLDLFDGMALGDGSLCALLHTHCPNLEGLNIFQMRGDNADHVLATFIGGMAANQLRSFENQSHCGISNETCLALSHHGQSLRSLKVSLSEEGVMDLALLQGCTSLQLLSIACDRPLADPKITQSDVFAQMSEWLKSCTSLKDVTLINIISAPNIVTPMLLNKDVSLERLDINGKDDALYVVKDNHDFHHALGQHQSLRVLHLGADPEPPSRDDIDLLIQALCSLKNLADLCLQRISDYFTDEQIIKLAQDLPELEELSVGGYGISDAVWVGLSTLRKLKTLSLTGLTTFTCDGIVEFVDQIGSGSHGLVLSVDNADPDQSLSQEEQDLLRELIAVKVEGRFEYQLIRDPNLIAFDGDSDDSD